MKQARKMLRMGCLAMTLPLMLGIMPGAMADGAQADGKLIALTFDDGPNTTTTAEVLGVLEEYGVVASFFLIGQNISASSEKLAKRAFDMGCEIDCHAWTHSDMTGMDEDAIQDEIDRCCDRIERITSVRPRFFRPPYISVNERMFETIDLTFISGVGCNDWMAEVTVEERLRLFYDGVRDGSIILLHDFAGNSRTVEVIRTAIPKLLEMGYTFVTVGDLFARKGITPKKHTVYSNVLQMGMW